MREKPYPKGRNSKRWEGKASELRVEKEAQPEKEARSNALSVQSPRPAATAVVIHNLRISHVLLKNRNPSILPCQLDLDSAVVSM